MLRVLIVDDSPFIRRLLGDLIAAEPDLQVVGFAQDGEEAVEKVRELRPDVVTLDVEMPRCGGLEALRRIMHLHPVPVVMVSSLTLKGAQETIEALQLGAVDVVAKPSGGPIELARVREELLLKLRVACGAKVEANPPYVPVEAVSEVANLASDRIVLIASSTGGPRALTELFRALPKGFPCPIVLVQHMPTGFTESLAERLSRIGPVRCREARDGDYLAPGKALVAPGGQHVTLDRRGMLRLSDGPTIHGVRPAADCLFLSAANSFGPRCVGLVLTGMGRDGAEGAAAIRKAGGLVLGESATTCTIYGMPRAAQLAGGIDAEHPIGEMAGALIDVLRGDRAA